MSFCSELQTGIHYVVFQAFGDLALLQQPSSHQLQVFHDALVWPLTCLGC